MNSRRGFVFLRWIVGKSKTNDGVIPGNGASRRRFCSRFFPFPAITNLYHKYVYTTGALILKQSAAMVSSAHPYNLMMYSRSSVFSVVFRKNRNFTKHTSHKNSIIIDLLVHVLPLREEKSDYTNRNKNLRLSTDELSVSPPLLTAVLLVSSANNIDVVVAQCCHDCRQQ